jgi:L-rhamnonate dehydratase
MKIKSIDAWRLNRPAPAPHPMARRPGYLASAPHAFPIAKYPEFSRVVRDIPGVILPEIWVRITAEDGTWGIGQGHWGDLVEPIVRAHFAPLLVGRDCLALEYLNDLMWRYSQRFGATGLASVAKSAIDQALWDLKGKLLGVPVYSLIGGPCREAVELYVTTDDLDWAMELGFKAFKISNPVHYDEGLAGINRLEEKVATARETVGPDAELMLNPNMSFNVEFAARLIERLLPYRLRWIEEPLIPADLEGHAALKKAFPMVPIATGEDHHGRHAFRQLVEQRSVDILQPDLRWCGGLTEGLKIYTIAEAAGLATIPHAGGSVPAGIHFAYALPESAIAEYWMPSAPGVPLKDGVLPGQPWAVDGRLKPSDAPGFGLELREADFSAWGT